MKFKLLCCIRYAINSALNESAVRTYRNLVLVLIEFYENGLSEADHLLGAHLEYGVGPTARIQGRKRGIRDVAVTLDGELQNASHPVSVGRGLRSAHGW